MFKRRGAAVLAAVSLVVGFTQIVPPASSANASGGSVGNKATRSSSKTSSGSTLLIRSSQKTGVIQTSPRVYLVVWGSQWKTDTTGAVAALQGLFGSLFTAQDTWGPILEQYCEGIASGTSVCPSTATFIKPIAPVYGATYYDTQNPAPAKATTAQLAAEAVKAAAAENDYSVNAQYVILSPSGTHPGGFSGSSFCGWHASTTSPGGNISYTNLPFVPDLGVGACTTLSPAHVLDGYESTETHEFAESTTDPFPSTGWLAKNGEEIGDLCISSDTRETFGTTTYDMQGLWSNQARACVTSAG